MPHDLRGNELKEGDAVVLRGTVKSVSAGEEYCNITIESEHGRQPDGLKETVTFNAAVLEKVGILLLALCSLLGGQLFAEEKDVPSSARREIAMRGEMIEHVDGQVRADAGEDLIGQAAETPPDDSGKWHLTVLTVGNNQACEKLLADLKTAPAFRDWVNLDDHQASHLHVHVLRYDGAVGKDWGRKLEKFLGREIREFPTIIVQPPVNGSFGKHTDVAFLQHGYDGHAERLVADMAKDLGKYCQKVQRVRLLARRDGLRQEGADDVAAEEDWGAYQIPFQVAPTNPPPTPGLWNPATVIPPRVAATVEQIRAACPDCDAEFLLSQLGRQATLEEAAAAWQQVSLVKQIAELKRLQEEAAAKKKAEEEAAANTPAAAPPAGMASVTPARALAVSSSVAPAGGFSATTLLTAVLATFLGGGGLGSLVAWGLTALRKRRQASGQPTIPEGVFNQIVQAVLAALAAQPPKAP
jgi:hypothetical protein